MKRAVLLSILLFMVIVGPFLGGAMLDTSTIEAQGGPSATPSAPASGATFFQAGIFPRAMAFDGTLVWVANWYDNSITRLLAVPQNVGRPEEDKGQVVDAALHYSNPARTEAQGPVALAWDGRYMWVAFYEDNLVMVIDPSTTQAVATFAAGEGIQAPVALMYDGANVWVLNQGTVGTVAGYLRRFVGGSPTPIEGRCNVGRWPTAMTLDGAGNIWVTNGLDNTVMVLDKDDCNNPETIRTIDVQSFPMTIAFDGIHVWVGHYGRFSDEDRQILAIDAATFKLDDEIKIENLPGEPQRPIQLLYAFEQVWVTDVHLSPTSGSVAIIRAIDGSVVTQSIPITDPSAFIGSMVYTDDEIWAAEWLTGKIHVVLNAEQLRGIWEPNPENPVEIITRTPGIPLPTPLPTATLVPTATPTPCDTAFPPRLVVGGRGIVNDDINLGLRLRDNPGSLNTNVVGTYPPGTQFDVLDGHVCIELVAWWKVKVEDTEGWFAETLRETSGRQTYTVDPLPASGE